MAFNPFRRKSNLPTNERLLKAITVLATAGTPEARRTFYSTLLDSKLLLAEESASSRPVLFGDEAEEVILPIFTDLERLQKVCPDAQRYSAMSTRDICRLALKSDTHRININPEHGPGGFLERHEVEALAHGEIPDLSGAEEPSFDEPTFIPMGNPKLPTQDVLDAMFAAAQSLLEEEPGVDEGYVILTKSDAGDSVLTIALRFNTTISADAKTAFTGRFVPAIEKVIGRPLGLLWLEGERYQAVKSKSEPFYKRGERYN